MAESEAARTESGKSDNGSGAARKAARRPAAAKAAPGAEKHEFQAEVSRLLHLMVNSVYSETEVFLRELISNAADACDKLRYEALTRPELLADDVDLGIVVATDPAQGTLRITDNGIGMSHDELVANLGTIARSGTQKFVESLACGNDGVKLIGQFGVGFYSAFMVAGRVDAWSRRAGETDVWKWSSDGQGSFTVEPVADDDPLAPRRGTSIVLSIADAAKEYLDAGRLERIIKAYSDHIAVPISLVEVADGSAAEPRQINTASALWTRPRSEITEQQYRDFYRHTAGLFDEPALTVHYKAEGRHEYTVLFYVPTKQPFDLFDPSRRGRQKLYVRRVFITDDAEFLPGYLRFVRGVIDSEDMPLNVSREMLQNNPIVGAIRKAVTNRMVAELKKTAETAPETYATIWEAFGPVIKEGLYEDVERRDQLLELARFRTTTSNGNWRSLREYVADLRPNQTAIYYVTGEDEAKAKASPHLEGFRARGIEVLLLSDPVDHFWTTSVIGFDGKPFRSVTQGVADLAAIPRLDGDGATAEEAVDGAAIGSLIAVMKQALGDAVQDVRKSERLHESACCLVSADTGIDRNLEKILSRYNAGGVTCRAPVLEINPCHRLIRTLAHQAKQSGATAELEDAARLLLDQAHVLEGEPVADPAAFAERLSRLVERVFPQPAPADPAAR